MALRDSLDRFEQFATDVILERRFGKRAMLLRWFLYLLSWVFRGIAQTRNRGATPCACFIEKQIHRRDTVSQ